MLRFSWCFVLQPLQSSLCVFLESHSRKDFILPANPGPAWPGPAWGHLFSAAVNAVYIPAVHWKTQDSTPQRSDSPASVWLGSPCESSHFISIGYFYRGVLFLLRRISLSWTGPTATKKGGAVETDSVVASNRRRRESVNETSFKSL